MFLATGLTAAAQDNLVKNGDFENWDGGVPAQWQKSSKGSPSNATVKEAAEGRSGKALEVEHKGEGKKGPELALPLRCAPAQGRQLHPFVLCQSGK